MARIYLVRHGEAAVHWTAAEDAELSTVGLEQATAVAQTLARHGPLSIYSSPLRRARATALPLETLWQRPAIVEAAVTEIPTQGVELAQRSEWLMALAARGWQNADVVSRAWRRGILDFIASIQSDAVVFTHFVAINAVVGAALEQDAVYLFRPANTSITVVETENGRVRLIEQGAEFRLSSPSPA
jgi:broad specificity phosphatase PhoE